jgi:hypothetical protein
MNDKVDLGLSEVYEILLLLKEKVKLKFVESF